MSDRPLLSPAGASAPVLPFRQVTCRHFSALMLGLGALLVLLAYVQAAAIPERAHRDFDRLVQQLGGHMTHSATYPDTYRQMSADRRLLQNAYLGGGGLLLLTVGAFGLASSLPKEG